MNRRLIVIMMSMVMICPILEAKSRLCIFPFQAVGVDSVSVRTSSLLLRQALEKNGAWELLVPAVKSDPSSDWFNLSGIVSLARHYKGDLALNVSFSRLGEKIIVSYRLIDVNGDSILISDQATATTVDDLDVVMDRVSRSIISRRPFSAGTELGLVTDQESQAFKTRQALLYGGLNFGYLFPQAGFDQERKRSFCLDIISTYESKGHLVYGMAAVRKGFALTLGYSYMLNSAHDFSPYIGTGFGFHWIGHDNDRHDHRRGDGFEIIAKTGFMAYRTYNFRIMINLDWSYVFNDYDDQSLVLTIGLLHAGSRFLGIF
ncbi:MAG: hypothetical protein KBA26_06685 [Candidatus Delongbacteria bacterium]|nr:hypothetical protein [Candidatus Delongbacteria bacterium]